MRESKADVLACVSGVVRSKLVAGSTVEYFREDGTRVIRFHHTDIVTFSPDGKTITLDSGGWKTATTKERMNRYVSIRLWSERGTWWVGTYGTPLAERVAFFDGIQIVHGKLPAPTPKIFKRERAMGDKIIKFVKKLDKMKEIPKPGSGDCWLCLMHSTEPTDNPRHSGYPDHGMTMGEMGDDESDRKHLWEHVTSGYLHGSLLVNAMRADGYRDDQIALHYSLNSRDCFKKSLRRYLRRRMGLAQS